MKLQGRLPLIFTGTYRRTWGRIVKAADKLCAYIKCIEEKKSGNVEFERARKIIHKKHRKACGGDGRSSVFYGAFHAQL